MGKILDIFKSPLTLAAKTEMRVMKMGARAAFSLASLPLILGDIKTIISERGKTHEERIAAYRAREKSFYHKALRRGENLFEQFKAFQLYTFGRIGLLDSQYVKKNSGNYFSKKSPAAQIDTAIKWNKHGVFNEQDTLSNLGRASIWLARNGEDAKVVETSAQSWKKVFEWADDKVSSSLKNMKPKEQAKFAYGLYEIFMSAPVNCGETPGGMVIPPPHYEGERFYVIFNAKATKEGQPLVASKDAVELLPQAVKHLQERLGSSFYEENFIASAAPAIMAGYRETLKQLKSYQRNNLTPAS